MRQANQTALNGHFFEPAQQKAAEAAIFFDLTEYGFDIDPALLAQALAFCGEQIVSGLLTELTETETDADEAVLRRAGAFFFERTSGAILA